MELYEFPKGFYPTFFHGLVSISDQVMAPSDVPTRVEGTTFPPLPKKDDNC